RSAALTARTTSRTRMPRSRQNPPGLSLVSCSACLSLFFGFSVGKILSCQQGVTEPTLGGGHERETRQSQGVPCFRGGDSRLRRGGGGDRNSSCTRLVILHRLPEPPVRARIARADGEAQGAALHLPQRG